MKFLPIIYFKKKYGLVVIFFIIITSLLLFTNCGIPLLSGTIPIEPILRVADLTDFRVQIRQTQVMINDDPNLRLLLAYRFFSTDSDDDENLYRDYTNQLINNIFGASIIIQPNNRFDIQILSDQTGIVTVNIIEPGELSFLINLNSTDDKLEIILENVIIGKIPIPVEADPFQQPTAIGLFAFIRTYDQSTLQPIFSLVSGNDLGRLIVF
jgi:hypothetical protein